MSNAPLFGFFQFAALNINENFIIAFLFWLDVSKAALLTNTVSVVLRRCLQPSALQARRGLWSQEPSPAPIFCCTWLLV